MSSSPKYCILNYSSSKSPLTGEDSYLFWYSRHFMKIKADRPFGRGDVAKIVDVDYVTQTIEVEVYGNPAYERMPEDLPSYDDIPYLLFLRSRFYLDEDAVYETTHTSGVEVLIKYSNVIDHNQIVVLVVLLYESTGSITAHDDVYNDTQSWSLSRIDRE